MSDLSFHDKSQKDQKDHNPSVISITEFKKTKRMLEMSKNQSKAKNSQSDGSDKKSTFDKLFGDIIKKNKEAKKKRSQNRLQKNSHVLRNYNLK